MMHIGFFRDVNGRLLIEKTPGDLLDYSLDYAKDLAIDEIILTSTWSVPNGVTKGTEGKTAKVATVWLSDGVAGNEHPITNTVVTDQGRQFVRTFWLIMVATLS